MNPPKINIERLEKELMTIGYQLLHDAGNPTHTREAQRVVSTWARIEAKTLARRIL